MPSLPLEPEIHIFFAIIEFARHKCLAIRHKRAVSDEKIREGLLPLARLSEEPEGKSALFMGYGVCYPFVPV